ncbi:MAG: putative membrane-anchored protein [Francisellaceae bacterium]|jgi:uncharacterized membrane-anchored protein
MNEELINRVPIIIFSYWIIKIAATRLGETGADVLSKTMQLGYMTASLIFLGIFLILLIKKLRSKTYSPILYWLTFTATSLAGTAICDFMDRTLGLGYALGSSILLVLLLTLIVWYLSERSLSVKKIYTDKTEIFYWTAFLVSNTLGTAIGDYLADSIGLGFLGGALLIGGVLIVIVLLHFYTRVSTILLFWVAFILTRPFGANFGDFLTKPLQDGGANLGTIGSSLFFIFILIALLYREHKIYHKKKLFHEK